jgi:peptide/nickel transport system substrate-binding protein
MIRRLRPRLAIPSCAFVAYALFAGCVTTAKDARDDASGSPPPGACTCPGLAAPAADDAGGANPARGGAVAIAMASEPGTLLSMYSADPAVQEIADHEILEALTVLDPISGEPLPELAARWESAPGTGVVTFHLVRDARWHDGAPFTANDVKFTFDQLLDPAGGAVLRGDFLDVREVTAIDPSTVAVRLDRDRPELPAALSRVPILPAHVFGKEVVATHAAARAPIGTGPFRFSSWQPGARIVLERNAAFRGEAARCDRLIYRFVPDRRAALELFRAGGVDVVPGIGGARLGADLLAGARRIAFPREAFVGVVYNTQSPLFADAGTRRALGMLLDRAAVRCASLLCLAEDVSDPWPRSLSPRGASRVAFDPAAARRLLDAAGWRDADGDGVRERDGARLSFRFLLPDTDRDAVGWIALYENDLAAAGVDASIASVGWGVYTDRLRAHRFDAAVVTTPNARPFDPRALFHSAAAATERNFGSFSSPRMDAALERLAAAATAKRREAARLEIGAILDEEQPMAFAFRPGEAMLVRDAVRGVHLRGEWLDERRLWRDPAREVSR